MAEGDPVPQSSVDEEDGEKRRLVKVRRKFDPNFNGPIAKRGCTDIICCVLFGVYMIGMIVVGVLAYIEGDPKRLLYPTDTDGKVCGIDIPDKNFLYFFDLTKCLTKGASDPLTYVKQGFSCPTPQVCVSKCPTFTLPGTDSSIKVEDLVCKPNVNVTKSSDLDKLVSDGDCAPYYVKSEEVFYRCIPDIAVGAIASLGLVDVDKNPVNGSEIVLGETAIQILSNLQNFAMQVADELKVVWWWILIGFVLSMVLSMLYIILARWITFPLVITTAIGVLGLLSYATYFMFKRYKDLVDSGESRELVWRVSIKIDDFARNKTTWLVLESSLFMWCLVTGKSSLQNIASVLAMCGIVLAVMLLILLLIMIFLFHRVRIACALIGEASRAVCSMLSTLFFPLLPWLLQLIWLTWFLVVLVFLMSNGTKMYQVSHNDTNYNLTMGDPCEYKTFAANHPNARASCLFAKYEENQYLLRMQVFHLFGWLWGWQFLVAFAECSLAGAFASYYWAKQKPKDVPSFPVFAAMWRAISYHTGSLALGASIIAIVKLVRIILEYIFKKLGAAKDNPVAKFFMCCLRCCFWCLEKCLRFLNKNAYIMIAIYGKNFCVSAKEAFSLLLTNPARVIAINGITSFLLFLGKLLVTGSIGVASFFWFAQYNANLPDKLQYTIVPIVICTLGAYIVATLFFNVYDMGIDTLFLSFLEDLERNDGSAEKPYFMTKSLKSIMSKENVGDKPDAKPTEEVPL